VQAYPAEYRDLTHDAALLHRLAETTRGAALTLDHPPEQVFAGPRTGRASFRPLAPYLLVAAAVLLLLEVAVRRLSIPEAWLLAWRPRSTPQRAEPSRGMVERLRSHKETEREAAALRRQKESLAQSAASARPDPAPAVPERLPPPKPKPPPPARPKPKPKPKPKPDGESEGGSMSKLLEAKRKARRKRDD
jgi:outer membrane biosynthesis protein TonB